MNIKLILLAVSLVAVPTISAVEINASLDIRIGKVPPPPPPEVIVIVPTPRAGPPPWAPAHGARRNHTYYYYPGADVYFRPEDRTWFYLEGSQWRLGINLPPSIRVDFERAVAVDMETDRPYQFHNEVRGYYPADYFVTKVKVKEKPDKPGKEQPEHRETDAPGKSQGKGKGKNK